MRTVLETPRLLLDEMSPADVDFMAAMLADPAVMRFFPKVCDRDEAAAAVRRNLDRYARDGFGLWLVREKSSGGPVGRVGLVRQQVDGTGEVEVGWMIHRPYQRRGYATEAARACRDHAFAALSVPRVISLVRPENLPSCGVAAKLGMTPAGRTLHAGFEHVVYARDWTTAPALDETRR